MIFGCHIRFFKSYIQALVMGSTEIALGKDVPFWPPPWSIAHELWYWTDAEDPAPEWPLPKDWRMERITRKDLKDLMS